MERLIKYDALIEAFNHADSDIIVDYEDGKCDIGFSLERIQKVINSVPDADVSTVRHGRWERCGGDLHSSGYAIYCSICNKTHFVHYKYSLGGLYGCKELFEKPKHCPSCGAFMEVEE